MSNKDEDIMQQKIEGLKAALIKKEDKGQSAESLKVPPVNKGKGQRTHKVFLSAKQNLNRVTTANDRLRRKK